MGTVERFEDIFRGAPRSETIDLRTSSSLVMTVPLSRAPDARWIHLFRMAIGVADAVGTKAPPIVGDAAIVQTTDADAGRALRVLDERIEAANRAYRINRPVDLVDEEQATVPAASPVEDTEQLAVLDRLLGT